jgi:hypothetical protein
VARAWDSVAIPALASSREAEPVPAAADLDFVGPPPVIDRAVPEDPEEAASREFTEVEFWLLGIGESDFTGNQGQLATQRGGWRAAFGRYRPGGTSYALGVFTEASFYDFGGGRSPVPGVSDPFNDVYEMSLSGRFLVQQSERFEWYGGAQFALAGEDRSELGDSVVAGGALAMRYRAAPQFALLAGIAGMSRFDDSPWILPYLGFDWQVTDSLRLSPRPPRSTPTGSSERAGRWGPWPPTAFASTG